MNTGNIVSFSATTAATYTTVGSYCTTGSLVLNGGMNFGLGSTAGLWIAGQGKKEFYLNVIIDDDSVFVESDYFLEEQIVEITSTYDSCENYFYEYLFSVIQDVSEYNLFISYFRTNSDGENIIMKLNLNKKMK